MDYREKVKSVNLGTGVVVAIAWIASFQELTSLRRIDGLDDNVMKSLLAGLGTCAVAFELLHIGHSGLCVSEQKQFSVVLRTDGLSQRR